MTPEPFSLPDERRFKQLLFWFGSLVFVQFLLFAFQFMSA